MSLFTYDWQSQTPEFVHALHHYMYDHGVATPKPIGAVEQLSKPGSRVKFQVTEFVHARPLRGELNHEQLIRLGEELGKVHKCAQDFPLQSQEHKNPHKILGTFQLTGKLITDRSEVGSLSFFKGRPLPLLRNMAGTFQSRLLGRRSLPQGLLHGDINKANLLFDYDDPIFVDWERTRKGPYL